MTDKKHVLRPSKDYFNRAEISQEYFSPLLESSAANVHFYSPIEYSSPTSKTLKNEFPNENLNNTFEHLIHLTPKKVFENKSEVSLNDSSSTYISEMNFGPPKCYNNVSPTIEKLMRMMMPSSSTPKNSQTKRIFSSNCWSVDQVNEDSTGYTPIRKRLDSSFLSPKVFVCQEHSLDSSMLKATLTKEIDFQIVPSRCQECVDYFPDDKRAGSPDDKRAGSPDYEVKRVTLIYRA